jgi:hypothetical protein
LQIELRRVGCNTGAVVIAGGAGAVYLLVFNKNAQTKFDVKIASLDALDTIRSKTARICPLICDHGYKAEGDACTKVICKAGFEVGDDNTCGRIAVKKPEKPTENPAPSAERDGMYSFAVDHRTSSTRRTSRRNGSARCARCCSKQACRRGQVLEIIGGPIGKVSSSEKCASN